MFSFFGTATAVVAATGQEMIIVPCKVVLPLWRFVLFQLLFWLWCRMASCGPNASMCRADENKDGYIGVSELQHYLTSVFVLAFSTVEGAQERVRPTVLPVNRIFCHSFLFAKCKARVLHLSLPCCAVGWYPTRTSGHRNCHQVL